MEALINYFNDILAVINSQTFWTAIGAIGTIGTLYYIYRQIANARNISAFEFLRKEDDRFSSEGMRRNRNNLAEVLLIIPDNYKIIEPIADYVLGYFEDLGLMLRKGLAPEFFTWTFNCYYVLRYWKASEKYVKWLRETTNDLTWYSEFEYLYQRMLKYEKKLTKKKKIELTKNEIQEFLIEELKKGELISRLNLRPFLLSDLDRVMKIENSAFSEAEAYPRHQFEELYREHPEGFFVAELLGQVMGYVIGYISDKLGEIDSIAVDETFRHLRIGQSLMEIIINTFREKGIKICSLEVRTTNEAAIFFHQSIGFKIEQTLKNYYEDGTNAYLMHLQIK